MKAFLKGLALAAMVLGPQGALADDAALVVVASDYRRLPDVPGDTQAGALAQSLEAEGFRVTSTLDRATRDTLQAVAKFREDAAEAERVFVLLSGHVVSTARETYLLTRFAFNPTDLTIGSQGVPLGPILDTLAEHPGQAVIMLATSGDAIEGIGLAPGAAPEVPQGVTLVTGPIGGLMRVAREVFLEPGELPASALRNPPRGVSVRGFVSDAAPFLPDPSTGTVVIEREGEADMELAYWQVVETMASVAGYEAYLDAYPDGRFTENARDAIDQIEGDEQSRIVEEEDALALNREARRDVQRYLSILGFDPRGIDGIFGPGTRAAIAAWQRAEAYLATGYLNAEQLRALRDDGAARAAELEAEAEARRAEQERLDRAYWRQTGRGSTENGLRDYLARYPDGLFSDIARSRLDEIEAAARAQAEAQERQFWDAARAEDSVDSYTRYLELYPNGLFVESARARLNELTADDDQEAVIAAAQAEESQIAGNTISRLLIETRLAALGLEPGIIDGDFNGATRRAIRQFQRTRGLVVTGYVTRETFARLLSASP